MACFLSERSRATDFLSLKNPSSSAGFEPANLGFKYDNHRTTEADFQFTISTSRRTLRRHITCAVEVVLEQALKEPTT
jgi:hypothetical protein